MANNARGIVRKIDSVGRIVIPIEIYRQARFVGREEEVNVVPTEDYVSLEVLKKET